MYLPQKEDGKQILYIYKLYYNYIYIIIIINIYINYNYSNHVGISLGFVLNICDIDKGIVHQT